MDVWLGCIADDYTGATDLSSMLVRAGLRVIQCFGTPPNADGLTDVDAIVIALKSRSIPAPVAVQLSLEALSFLRNLGCQRFFFKYCSTFDSTDKGNIGPVADALADALLVDQLLFCPAFPENGRTLYNGYLFVNGLPLHETGMRQHPLNPMLDSNLLRVLQAQSTRRVGHLGLQDELMRAQTQHIIVDAISDDDLKRTAKLAADHRLLSGGSAIARYWAEAIATHVAVSSYTRPSASEDCSAGVVLAGSCSEATRQQVAEFERRHPVLQLDVGSMSDEQLIVRQALAWYEQHRSGSNSTGDKQQEPLLICSARDSAAVEAARNRFGERPAAEITERIFAAIARGLRERGITRLIVAGGETSGAVINELNVRAVRIGQEIAPGVPWINPLGQEQFSLALKSGNFGGPCFFLDALGTMR